MSGTLTTTFLWILASSRPSRRISSLAMATTSAETGPSTISQISAITSCVGFPALARSDGLVVTPSIAPIACASLISAMSPVSMKGRRLTSYPSLRTDLRNAGAEWVDEEVVTDDGIVTSRGPKDIPAFDRKMIEEIGEGRHERRKAV